MRYSLCSHNFSWKLHFVTNNSILFTGIKITFVIISYLKKLNCLVSVFGNLCCYLRFYRESLPITSVRHHSYDPDGKTTVQLLNKNLEVLMIDSYSQVTTYCNHIHHMYDHIPMKWISRVSCIMQLMDIYIE